MRRSPDPSSSAVRPRRWRRGSPDCPPPAMPMATTRHGHPSASQPAASSMRRRSSRLPRTGSAPPPTQAARATPRAGACAGRRQSRRSAPATLRRRSSSSESTGPAGRSPQVLKDQLTSDYRHVRKGCVPPRTRRPASPQLPCRDRRPRRPARSRSRRPVEPDDASSRPRCGRLSTSSRHRGAPLRCPRQRRFPCFPGFLHMCRAPADSRVRRSTRYPNISVVG